MHSVGELALAAETALAGGPDGKSLEQQLDKYSSLEKPRVAAKS